MELILFIKFMESFLKGRTDLQRELFFDQVVAESHTRNGWKVFKFLKRS